MAQLKKENLFAYAFIKHSSTKAKLQKDPLKQSKYYTQNIRLKSI